MERKTKIICTLGPASNDYETIKNLALKGMNASRLNFSHGGWETQQKIVDLVKKVRNDLNLPIAIILDTMGPEMRIGKLENEIFLQDGQIFILKNEDIIGNINEVSISYKELYKHIYTDLQILLADGTIRLKVIKLNNQDIVCKVINGGKLSSQQSINIPDLKLDLPSLSAKDYKDIQGAILNDIDYIALSFVRCQEDVLNVRKLLHNHNIKIIAKIENKEGIDNFDSILKVSDGIMVARGDLGVELPYTDIPIYQKQMIKKTYKEGKIVITATQMLESMLTKPMPTRAEVSDIANAIYDGTCALMLSEETATGAYPDKCVQTMQEIALRIENSIDYWAELKQRDVPKINFEFIIDYALVSAALNLDIKAIICFSKTGDTPRILASLRPKCPIYVITNNLKNYEQLSLVWGINVILDLNIKQPKEYIKDAINLKIKEGFLKKSDILLIAGGKYLQEEKDINKSIGGIYQI